MPKRLNIEELQRRAAAAKLVPLRKAEKPVFPRKKLSAVPFTQVQITDKFWQRRLEANRKITIPFSFDKFEATSISNFAKAGRSSGGKFKGNCYDDADLYKIIEGAAYCLHNHRDKDLEKHVDNIVDTIAAAQWEDGYLYTFYSLPQRQPKKRWTDTQNKHELFCAGQLFEAAVAYYRATGKRKLLDVAIKLADHVDSVFGPDKKHDVPGHPEIEIALVKLFQETANKNYLNLARFFLEERGQHRRREHYGIYFQDHKPVIRQNEAVGHAVRALYMYCGMADVAAATNNYEYVEALDKLWWDVISTKMYVTGGVGARHENEGFGHRYELPNKTAYSETCASIAMAMWNHRMFLVHRDAKYIDVFERVLFNGLLSGVSMDGDSFFYPNVLESDGKLNFNKGAATRQPWFDCSCCPTNVGRFMPSVPGYVYAQENNVLYVNLFVTSSAYIGINNEKTLRLDQQTDYPWDGQIRFTVDTAGPAKVTLKIRIPGWSRNDPTPSDLYYYMNHSDEKATLKVNGRQVKVRMEKGFVVLDRIWKAGDAIDLNLPMPVRRVLCHMQVIENQGKVALERGPIVYCAEWTDNNGRVSNIALPDDEQLKVEYRKDLLNGVVVITGTVDVLLPGRNISATTKTRQPFLAIPYYAWSHRGQGEMAVWLNRRVL